MPEGHDGLVPGLRQSEGVKVGRWSGRLLAGEGWSDGSLITGFDWEAGMSKAVWPADGPHKTSRLVTM